LLPPSFRDNHRAKATLSLLLALSSLILYLFTLSPTINFGDSPELISSAYTLGIAHPPGYPLYSLTGKLFTYIPWGDGIAQKVNFASAFFSAAAIFFIAMIVASSGKTYSLEGAIISALFLMASPTLWSQSVISEVYSLNLFLFTLLLYLSFLWWKTSDKRYLFAAVFIYGLALANHHTLIAFIPLLLTFILPGKRKDLKGLGQILFLCLFFFLGFSIYIYLPLRAMQSPPMNWGDPQTLGRFIDVIMRRQFPTIDTPFTLQTASMQIAYYSKALIREFTLSAMPLAIWGCIRIYKLGIAPFLFLLALFTIHGIGTLFFLNPSTKYNYANVNVMMLPSYAIFAIWIGWGIKEIAETLSNTRLGKGIALSLLIIFGLLAVYKGIDSFDKNDESSNYFAIDYGTNIFSSMDKDGVIFVESDTVLFPLWYLQFVEGKRPDAAVMDVDFLMLPWFKGQIKKRYKNIEINIEDLGKHTSGPRKSVGMKNMLDAFKVGQIENIMDGLPDSIPIYLSYELGPVYRRFKNIKNTYIINEGIIYKISKTYERPDTNKWDAFELRSLINYPLSPDPYTRALAAAYSSSMQRRAQQLFIKGDKKEAMKIIKKIKEIKAGAKAAF
jgi:hypothetical protein